MKATINGPSLTPDSPPIWQATGKSIDEHAYRALLAQASTGNVYNPSALRAGIIVDQVTVKLFGQTWIWKSKNDVRSLSTMDDATLQAWRARGSILTATTERDPSAWPSPLTGRDLEGSISLTVGGFDAPKNYDSLKAVLGFESIDEIRLRSDGFLIKGERKIPDPVRAISTWFLLVLIETPGSEELRIDIVDSRVDDKTKATLGAWTKEFSGLIAGTDKGPRWSFLELAQSPGEIPFYWSTPVSGGGWACYLAADIVVNLTNQSARSSSARTVTKIGARAAVDLHDPKTATVKLTAGTPARKAPLTYGFGKEREGFACEDTLPLVYDPVQVPRMLRQELGLSLPEDDGSNDTIYAFAKFEEGWVELPFPNSTEATLRPRVAPSNPRANVLSGSIVFGNEPGQRLAPTLKQGAESTWQISLDGTAAIDGSWTFQDGLVEEATLNFYGPDISAAGLFSLGRGRPTAEDCIPDLDNWVSGLMDLPLRSPRDNDYIPAFGFDATFDFNCLAEPISQTLSSHLASWTVGIRLSDLFKKEQWPAKLLNPITVWRRSTDPLIQTLPLTQSKAPANYPAQSRALIAYQFGKFVSDSLSWIFSTQSAGQWPLVTGVKGQATPWTPLETWTAMPDLGLTSLRFPLLNAHPKANGPDYPDFPGVQIGLSFDPGPLKQHHALATLQEPDPNQSPAAPPLTHDSLPAHWGRLQEAAALAAADDVDLLGVAKNGVYPITSLLDSVALEATVTVSTDAGGLQQISLVCGGTVPLSRDDPNPFPEFFVQDNPPALSTEMGRFRFVAGSMAAEAKGGTLLDQRLLTRERTSPVQEQDQVTLTRASQGDETATEKIGVVEYFLATTLSPLKVTLSKSASTQLWLGAIPCEKVDTAYVFTAPAVGDDRWDYDVNDPTALSATTSLQHGFSWGFVGSEDGRIMVGNLTFFSLRLVKVVVSAAKAVTQVVVLGRLQFPASTVPVRDRPEVDTLVYATFALGEDGSFQLTSLAREYAGPVTLPGNGVWELQDPFSTDRAKSDVRVPALHWRSLSWTSGVLSVLAKDSYLSFSLLDEDWEVPLAADVIVDVDPVVDTCAAIDKTMVVVDGVQLTLEAANPSLKCSVRFRWGFTDTWQGDLTLTLGWDLLTGKQNSDPHGTYLGTAVGGIQASLNSGAVGFSWAGLPTNPDPASAAPPHFIPGIPFQGQASGYGVATMTWTATETKTGDWVQPVFSIASGFAESHLNAAFGTMVDLEGGALEKGDLFSPGGGRLRLQHEIVYDSSWKASVAMAGQIQVVNLYSWPRLPVSNSGRVILPGAGEKTQQDHLRHRLNLFLNDQKIPLAAPQSHTDSAYVLGGTIELDLMADHRIEYVVPGEADKWNLVSLTQFSSPVQTTWLPGNSLGTILPSGTVTSEPKQGYWNTDFKGFFGPVAGTVKANEATFISCRIPVWIGDRVLDALDAKSSKRMLAYLGGAAPNPIRQALFGVALAENEFTAGNPNWTFIDLPFLGRLLGTGTSPFFSQDPYEHVNRAADPNRRLALAMVSRLEAAEEADLAFEDRNPFWTEAGLDSESLGEAVQRARRAGNLAADRLLGSAEVTMGSSDPLHGVFQTRRDGKDEDAKSSHVAPRDSLLDDELCLPWLDAGIRLSGSHFDPVVLSADSFVSGLGVIDRSGLSVIKEGGKAFLRGAVVACEADAVYAADANGSLYRGLSAAADEFRLVWENDGGIGITFAKSIYLINEQWLIVLGDEAGRPHLFFAEKGKELKTITPDTLPTSPVSRGGIKDAEFLFQDKGTISPKGVVVVGFAAQSPMIFNLKEGKLTPLSIWPSEDQEVSPPRLVQSTDPLGILVGGRLLFVDEEDSVWQRNLSTGALDPTSLGKRGECIASIHNSGDFAFDHAGGGTLVFLEGHGSKTLPFRCRDMAMMKVTQSGPATTKLLFTVDLKGIGRLWQLGSGITEITPGGTKPQVGIRSVRTASLLAQFVAVLEDGSVFTIRLNEKTGQFEWFTPEVPSLGEAVERRAAATQLFSGEEKPFDFQTLAISPFSQLRIEEVPELTGILETVTTADLYTIDAVGGEARRKVARSFLPGVDTQQTPAVWGPRALQNTAPKALLGFMRQRVLTHSTASGSFTYGESYLLLPTPSQRKPLPSSSRPLRVGHQLLRYRQCQYQSIAADLPQAAAFRPELAVAQPFHLEKEGVWPTGVSGIAFSWRFYELVDESSMVCKRGPDTRQYGFGARDSVVFRQPSANGNQWASLPRSFRSAGMPAMIPAPASLGDFTALDEGLSYSYLPDWIRFFGSQRRPGVFYSHRMALTIDSKSGRFTHMGLPFVGRSPMPTKIPKNVAGVAPMLPCRDSSDILTNNAASASPMETIVRMAPDPTDAKARKPAMLRISVSPCENPVEPGLLGITDAWKSGLLLRCERLGDGDLHWQVEVRISHGADTISYGAPLVIDRSGLFPIAVSDSVLADSLGTIASAMPAGDELIVRLSVCPVPTQGTNPLVETLEFPFRRIRGDTVCPPLEPRFVSFEDMEYDQLLTSPSLVGKVADETVVLASDRRTYNPWSEIILGVRVPGAATLQLGLLQPGGDPIPLQVQKGVESVALGTGDSFFRVSLSDLQRVLKDGLKADQLGVTLKSGDTLEAVVLQAGAPVVNIQMGIVGDSVLPAPEAAFGLIRMAGPRWLVQRFAWHPSPLHVQLLDPPQILAGVAMRRAVFRWTDTVRVGSVEGYWVMKIRMDGSTRMD